MYKRATRSCSSSYVVVRSVGQLRLIVVVYTVKKTFTVVLH